MSHFAKLDSNNVVTEVIKSEQDFINSGAVGDSFLWVQTSYNGNFRGRFAQMGGTYDKVNEVFIDAKPFASWTLDSSFEWQPPVARPSDMDEVPYRWSESTYQADNTAGWVSTA